MMRKSLLYVCVVCVSTLTIAIPPANAGSYDMASNTTYEKRADLQQAANDDYADKSISHARQANSPLDAAATILTNKECDRAYTDFSKAFRPKEHAKKESAPETIINTINQVTLAVIEFIVSL